jgi:uncharacterized membrane protein
MEARKKINTLAIALGVLILPIILNMNFWHLEMLDFIKTQLLYLSLMMTTYFLYPQFKIVCDLSHCSYGVIRTLTYFILGSLTWFCSRWVQGVEVFIFYMLMIGVAISFFWKRKDHFEILWGDLSEIFKVELVFYTVFLITLTYSSFHPMAIYGEKPMDYSFLSYLMNNLSLPVEDPWMSGTPLKYYYQNFFNFAVLLRSFALSPVYGYHIAFSLIPAFFAVSCYSFLRSYCDKFSAIIVSLMVLIFGGNFQSIFQLIKNEKGFSSFWKTSRIFNKGLFYEFPSWSFSFMDLHPHVMSMPLVITFLYFLSELWKRSSDCFSYKRLACYSFLTSIIAGTLFSSNLWDFLFCFVILGVFLINKKILKSSFTRVVTLGALLLVFIYYPYIGIFSRGGGVELSFFTENLLLKNIFYFLFIPLVLFLLAYIFNLKNNKDTCFKVDSFFGRLGIALILIFLFSTTGIFIDRTNTVFKFLTSFSYVVTLISLVFFARSFHSFSPWKRVVSSMVLTLFIFSGFYNSFNLLKFPLYQKHPPKLHAYHYLKRENSKLFETLTWIEKYTKVDAVLLQKYSHSYDYDSGLFSILTGRKSYLTWPNHLIIRGADRAEIVRRKRNVDQIYNTTDALTAYEMLKRENIHYVIISDKEKKNYSRLGLVKFSQFGNLFVRLFQKGDYEVFAVL